MSCRAALFALQDFYATYEDLQISEEDVAYYKLNLESTTKETIRFKLWKWNILQRRLLSEALLSHYRVYIFQVIQ